MPLSWPAGCRHENKSKFVCSKSSYTRRNLIVWLECPHFTPSLSNKILGQYLLEDCFRVSSVDIVTRLRAKRHKSQGLIFGKTLSKTATSTMLPSITTRKFLIHRVPEVKREMCEADSSTQCSECVKLYLRSLTRLITDTASARLLLLGSDRPALPPGLEVLWSKRGLPSIETVSVLTVWLRIKQSCWDYRPTCTPVMRVLTLISPHHRWHVAMHVLSTYLALLCLHYGLNPFS